MVWLFEYLNVKGKFMIIKSGIEDVYICVLMKDYWAI